VTEKHRKQIVYTIFILAVSWAVFNFPHRKKLTSVEPPQSSEVPAAVTVTAGAAGSGPALEVPEQWGRDPFVRGGERASSGSRDASPALRVAAVSVAAGKAMAIINGKLVGQGDMIQGWHVLNISSDVVVLEANGRKITLTVGNG